MTDNTVTYKCRTCKATISSFRNVFYGHFEVCGNCYRPDEEWRVHIVGGDDLDIGVFDLTDVQDAYELYTIARNLYGKMNVYIEWIGENGYSGVFR